MNDLLKIQTDIKHKMEAHFELMECKNKVTFESRRFFTDDIVMFSMTYKDKETTKLVLSSSSIFHAANENELIDTVCNMFKGMLNSFKNQVRHEQYKGNK